MQKEFRFPFLIIQSKVLCWFWHLAAMGRLPWGHGARSLAHLLISLDSVNSIIL